MVEDGFLVLLNRKQEGLWPSCDNAKKMEGKYNEYSNNSKKCKANT